MNVENIVILDGAGFADNDLSPVLKVLSDVLQSDGSQVDTLRLREMRLAHCLGCFGCWVKTPGICVEADAGREIAKAVIRSDVAVFFTPVTFGGYSPELKKIFDHFVQLISPFFQMDHGEVHHPPRYTHRPRLVMVGVQRHPNAAEAHVFKVLAGRNAINFHPPSYAAEVVLSMDHVDTLRARFEALRTRCDLLPFGDAVSWLMPSAVPPGATPASTNGRRALLIVGSPKAGDPSTSGALGGFLIDRLQSLGWQTESLTLRASLHRPEVEGELLAAVERASLILLVFPLYADALPYLLTKALALIASHRRNGHAQPGQRLMAVVNSGFPETHQSSVALAICREFSAQCGFAWAGGLAFAGGGMIGGRPLIEKNRPGPSVRHVVAALEMTAAALADGLPVPDEAISLIAKRSIPVALWSRLYMTMGSWSFTRLAARNGVSKDKLLAQPYAA